MTRSVTVASSTRGPSPPHTPSPSPSRPGQLLSAARALAGLVTAAGARNWKLTSCRICRISRNVGVSRIFLYHGFGPGPPASMDHESTFWSRHWHPLNLWAGKWSNLQNIKRKRNGRGQLSDLVTGIQVIFEQQDQDLIPIPNVKSIQFSCDMPASRTRRIEPFRRGRRFYSATRTA
jgi:hypothetical protein